MSIWVIKEGQREGPYEEQDVRELVYEGTYSDAEPAIRDGQLEWTTVGQLLNRQPPPPPDYVPPAVQDSVATPASLAESTPLATPPPIRRPRVTAPAQVAVVDFQMPFGSMVVLMVKWALAAIPALLILVAISALFWTFLLTIFTAAMRH